MDIGQESPKPTFAQTFAEDAYMRRSRTPDIIESYEVTSCGFREDGTYRITFPSSHDNHGSGGRAPLVARLAEGIMSAKPTDDSLDSSFPPGDRKILALYVSSRVPNAATEYTMTVADAAAILELWERKYHHPQGTAVEAIAAYGEKLKENARRYAPYSKDARRELKKIDDNPLLAFLKQKTAETKPDTSE